MNFHSLIFEENNLLPEKQIITRFNELYKKYNDLNLTFKQLKIEFEKNLLNDQVEGGTREIFVFDNVVVKFAKTKTQVFTNKKEIEAADCLGSFAPFIIDFDKNNYYWLVMERVDNNIDNVKQLAKKLFPNIKDIDLFGRKIDSQEEDDYYNNEDSYYAIQGINNRNNGDKYGAYERLKDAASEEGKEWLDSFVEIVKTCNFDTSDLIDFNWGIGLKTGRLIPLDLG